MGKNKKIALINNSNNNQYTILRYLVDRGLDVDLLMSYKKTPDHFHPEHDTYNYEYKSRIKDFNWVKPIDVLKVFVKRKERTKLIKTLAPYDLVIGNGLATIFGYFAKKETVFMQTGADIRDYPFYALKKNLFRTIIFNLSVYYFKKTLKSSKCCIAGTYLLENYKKIGVSEEKVKKLTFPMVYTGSYTRDIEQYRNRELQYFDEFRKIREKSELMIFSNCRQAWKDSSYPRTVQKRNDILVHSIDKLAKEYPEKTISVIFFEYGKDFGATKQLISDLNLDDYFHWFPVMSRKELMPGILLSDCVVAQLYPLANASGVVYESLSLGTPCLQYLDPNLDEFEHDKLYPYINVTDALELKDALKLHFTDKDKMLKLGNEGYDWYQQFVVNKTLDRWELEVIQ